jgi:hypothetical protein
MTKIIKKIIKKINLAIVNLKGLTPPEEIPDNLLKRYTLDGKIEIEKCYYNNVGLPFIPRIYTKRKIESFLKQIKNREAAHYKATDKELYRAIEKYPVENKNCVVMGSVSPFYESVCISFGAKTVTTIEYNKIIFLHPQMKTMTPAEYDKNPEQYDTGLSISSFEHDGLGRYGDPLNPEADLEAMNKMKKVIKKEGILFLSVPVGKDLLVWNAHRIYGRIRLPLLMKGWETLDTFGFDESKLDEPDKGAGCQPVFVLKNT